MMKKVMLILSCLFLSVGLIYSQTITVNGVVVDDAGIEVVGASVVVKGTTTGVATDIDGKFSLSAPANSTLVFSLVGMKKVEMKAAANMKVVMESDEALLSEVVVTGYGVMSKKNVVSSISKVNDEELKRLSVASVDLALQGAAPGVVVSANSGAPGGGNVVRLRGATTVSGSNTPLYVVDGIPIFTGNTMSDVYGGQGGDALSTLATSEIASVEVLKDASAVAIYGARASNGVILITTKRGKAGKARVEVNTSYAFQNAIKFYEMMDLGEYLKYADTAVAAAYPYTSYMSKNMGYANANNLDPKSKEMQDVYSLTSRAYADDIKKKNAPLYEINANVSGGNDRTLYYAGGSHYRQEGTVQGQDYKKTAVRFNIDQTLFDWLKFNGGVSFSDEVVNRTNGDNNIYAPTTTAALERPGFPIYNEDGTFNINDFNFSNPLQAAIGQVAEAKTQRYLGNIGLQATIIEGLVLNTKLSVDRLYVSERIYQSSATKAGYGKDGYAEYNKKDYNILLSTTTLSYLKQVDKFSLNALAGFEYQTSDNIFVYMAKSGFPSTRLEWPRSAANTEDADAYETGSKLASLFARFSTNYDDRYLAEVSLRADASSKFGNKHRIGYFPAGTVAWKLHNEAFFADVKEKAQVSEVKLRLGYGLSGNESAIGNYASRSLATAANYGGYPGMAITQLGDSNLSWETTTQFSTGIDLGFFDDRLTIGYEFFDKRTRDMLLNAPIPTSSGFRTLLKNVGEMKNTGHEVSVSGNIVRTADLTWDLGFAIATLDNRITKLYRDASGKAQPIDYGFVTRIDEGQSLGAFYVYDAQGLDDDGNVLYKKADGSLVNGDELQESDKIFAGKPLPDYSGSINTSLKYKGFDLSALFQFSGGYEIYRSSMEYSGSAGGYSFNKFKNQLNYWTPDNTNTNIPRPDAGDMGTFNNMSSSRFVEDASYMRFKNLTIGYTVPKRLLNNKIDLRVYFGADNLVTWTSYSGLDPEVTAFGGTSIGDIALGTDFFTQGLNRTFKFGCNLKF